MQSPAKQASGRGHGQDGLDRGFGHGPGIGSGGSYQFAITNGAVTGISRVSGDHIRELDLPDNATFAITGATITETITGSRATATLVYTLDAATGNYQLVSRTTVPASPTTTYLFTIESGKVTAVDVSHAAGDKPHDLKIGSTTNFTVNADGSITETSIQGNALAVTRYVASATAGEYMVGSDSTTWIQPGSATTALDVDGHDLLSFVISGGLVNAVSQVKADGRAVAVADKSGVAYSVLEAGYVLEVHTGGTRSSYEVYHDGNGDGVYTEVAHGSGTTVDLVGLKAQIASTFDTLL